MLQGNHLELKINDENISTQKKTGKKSSGKGKETTDETPPPKPKLKAGGIEVRLRRYFERETNDKILLQNLCMNPSDNRHTIFPIWFYRESLEETARIVKVNFEKRTCQEVSLRNLMGIIGQHLEMFEYEDLPDHMYCLGTSQIEKFAKGFRDTTRARIMPYWPKPLGFASSEEMYFDRWDFDPNLEATEKDYPFIDSYFQRITNRKALRQIIGSILDGKPLRKYSPLLYGRTGGGKSKLFMIIKMAFGEKAVANVPKTYSDKFSATFVKNTVAWMIDEVEAKYVASTMFKELSGADSYPVRGIGRDYQDVKLQGVFFMNCNESELKLPKDEAVTKNRVIAHEVLLPKVPWKTQLTDDEIKEKALAEFPAFMGMCIREFRELGGNRSLEYDNSAFDSYVDDDEGMDFLELFNARFEVIPGWDLVDVGDKSSLTCGGFFSTWEEMVRDYPSATKGKTIHKFRKFIREHLKIPKGTAISEPGRDIRGKEAKMMKGIKLKDNHRM
jgi:hypothetical protein